MTLEHLQYPIGKFEWGNTYTTEQTKKAIDEIAQLPEKLATTAQTIIQKKLFAKSYREGAMTAEQLIHHYLDVYLNAYVRTKWLLTEPGSEIKPYDESQWIAYPCAENITEAVSFFTHLIRSWVFLLQQIPEDRFNDFLIHPEYKVKLPLHELIAMYDWHGRHHLKHLDIIINS